MVKDFCWDWSEYILGQGAKAKVGNNKVGLNIGKSLWV